LSGRGRADAGLADHGVDLGYGLLPPTGRHHLTNTSGLCRKSPDDRIW
jgi:hypothetical protein